MSNSYYTSTSAAVDGTVIDASDLNNQLSAIQAGFDAVEAAIKRAIKVSSGETSDQVLGAAATRFNTALLFNASGVPVASSAWLADWSAGGYRLTSLGNPVAPQDAVTLSFLTTAIAATAGISPAGGPGFLYSNGTVLSWASQYPTQTGNAGRVLQTNGTTASWELKYPNQASQSGKFLTTNGTDASWGEVFDNAQTTFGATKATATVTVGGSATTTARRDARSAAGTQDYDVREEFTGGTLNTNGKGKKKTIAAAQTFTGVFGFEATHPLSNLGATESIDWANGGHQSGTLDQNCTITVGSPAAGYPIGPAYRLRLTQGGAGNFTMTWAGATIKWAGAVAPPAQAAGVIIAVYLDWTGAEFLGSWSTFY